MAADRERGDDGLKAKLHSEPTSSERDR